MAAASAPLITPLVSDHVSFVHHPEGMQNTCRISISEREMLVPALPKGSTENFEMMFFGYLIKNGVTQRSLFWAIQFGARNITIKSKTTLFLGWNELGSLGLRGISPTL